MHENLEGRYDKYEFEKDELAELLGE